MIRRHTLRFACAAAALLLSTPTHAIFRAYVAADGNDANPCTLLAPCRLLPAALTAVDAGGEIWMLDSANYNTAQVNINKSVSILAIPGAVGSLVATGGQSALNINLSPGRVSLRNLVIVQLGGADSGIRFEAGTTLSVTQCDLANLNSGSGAIFAGSGGTLTVTDTRIRNSAIGILANNGTRVTVERSRLENNQVGVYTSVGATTVTDSVLSGNGIGAWFTVAGINTSYGVIRNSTITGSSNGILIATAQPGDSAFVSVINTTISQGSDGISMSAGGSNAQLTLDGSSIVNNITPISVTGTPTIYTRGNNTVKHNLGGDNISGLTTPLGAQ